MIYVVDCTAATAPAELLRLLLRSLVVESDRAVANGAEVEAEAAVAENAVEVLEGAEEAVIAAEDEHFYRL